MADQGGETHRVETPSSAIDTAFSDTITFWGANTDLLGEQLGQADPPQGTFKTVAAGAGHSCAMRTDDTIICWGDAESPTGTFETLAAGGTHTCATRLDDTVIYWETTPTDKATLQQTPTRPSAPA